MEQQLNKYIDLSNNPFINSSLQLLPTSYYDITNISYPNGSIVYTVEFWQVDPNGNRLEHDYQRTFTIHYAGVVSSQRAAIDIFWNHLPQLAPYRINKARRFVGIANASAQSNIQALVNETTDEPERFTGFTQLYDLFTGQEVPKLVWSWLINDDETNYLDNKFGVESYQLIDALTFEYATSIYEVPPTNQEAILYQNRLKI